MRYQISGKQIDIGEALQSHVKSELGETVEKYSQRPTDAAVVFSKNGFEYLCEATVHLSTGLTAAAKGHADEIYAAFEACREKMDKQLRRYKRRLKDHHHGSGTEPTPWQSTVTNEYVVQMDDDTEAAAAGEAPVIIAESEGSLREMTVSEAVMQLDLTEKSFLLFRNAAHGRLSVVHRRSDGHVGWIDPQAETAKTGGGAKPAKANGSGGVR